MYNDPYKQLYLYRVLSLVMTDVSLKTDAMAFNKRENSCRMFENISITVILLSPVSGNDTE